EDLVLALVEPEEALLEHRAELRPALLKRLAPLVPHLGEGGGEPPDEVAADRLDLAVLLQDLARHVERQVVGGHHPAHEAQPRRQELLAVVHDEHALDLELPPAARVVVPHAERPPLRPAHPPPPPPPTPPPSAP